MIRTLRWLVPFFATSLYIGGCISQINRLCHSPLIMSITVEELGIIADISEAKLAQEVNCGGYAKIKGLSGPAQFISVKKTESGSVIAIDVWRFEEQHILESEEFAVQQVTLPPLKVCPVFFLGLNKLTWGSIDDVKKWDGKKFTIQTSYLPCIVDSGCIGSVFLFLGCSFWYWLFGVIDRKYRIDFRRIKSWRVEFRRQRALRKQSKAEWRGVPKGAISRAEPPGNPSPTQTSLSLAISPELVTANERIRELECENKRLREFRSPREIA